MAMKRKRATGSWEYCIRRKGLLPKPVYLTFADEAEGDAYVKRIEAMLDKRILPPELIKTDAPREESLQEVIRAYQLAVALPASDARLLGILRERIGERKISMVDY